MNIIFADIRCTAGKLFAESKNASKEEDHQKLSLSWIGMYRTTLFVTSTTSSAGVIFLPSVKSFYIERKRCQLSHLPIVCSIDFAHSYTLWVT